MASDVNYFTCTLGHATALKKKDPPKISYKNVLQMIQYQASVNPNAMALGMPELPIKDVSSKSICKLTFDNLAELTTRASIVLSQDLEPRTTMDGNTDEIVVALVCPSGIEFALAWLGLMRLGYTSLLLEYGFMGNQ
jgi:acyl-CoA synthetase (AMP-forming)/AMP-acid ligase II